MSKWFQIFRVEGSYRGRVKGGGESERRKMPGMILMLCSQSETANNVKKKKKDHSKFKG